MSIRHEIFYGILLMLSIPAFGFNIGSAGAMTAWKAYKGMLIAHPITTKSLTSGGMMTISDAICQKITRDNSAKDVAKTTSVRFDSKRMLHVAVTGIVWSGPIQHWWFDTLHKIVTINNPFLRLAVNLFLDAIIFSPLTVSGYFAMRSLLEGSGYRGACEKLSTRFFSTVVGAWKFWPLVNVINFSMVPLQCRVLYCSVFSLFWTGYLTHVNSKAIKGGNAATKVSKA